MNSDADRLQLRSLAERYAGGCDRRDAQLFTSAFHPDGALHVYNPAGKEEPSRIEGHEQLAQVPGRLGRYAATHHMLGQSVYEFADDGTATGETYCQAHHLMRGEDGASNYAMFIRYTDEYRRDDEGEWRIQLRRCLVDFADTRPAG